MLAPLRSLLDLLFPPACQVCGEAGAFPLCAGCLRAMTPIAPPICGRCGRPLRGPSTATLTCALCRVRPGPLLRIRAAVAYEGAAREAVHALKFRGCRALAVPMGDLMGACAAREWQGDAADLVVPIPLHVGREGERGFNQAHLLAVAAAGGLGVPVEPRGLRRTRVTEPQSALSREARRRNVRGAFAAHPAAVGGRRVLLIDDVITTGATLEAAAAALLHAGARGVGALVFARNLSTE